MLSKKKKLFSIYSGTNFLKVWIVILMLLTIVYLTLHFSTSPPGAIHKKITTEDYTILNDLKDTLPYRAQALNFLKSEYQLTAESQRMIEATLKNYDKKSALAILSRIGIKSHSFFWLDDDRAFLEVIFWALFGTICSFLYYYVENYKKDTLDEKEYPSYFAKLFYTPFVVFVVYLSPSMFSEQMSKSQDLDYFSLVIAFVLGFFSGRAIEMLDKLKNLLLPSTADVTTTASSPASIVPETIYVEAVKEKAGEWNELYGPLEGVSVAHKIQNGTDTGQFALQFHVVDKKSGPDPQKNIPATLKYVFQGQEYELLTDVVESGQARANTCYDKSDDTKYIGSSLNPKFLGLSCSRAGSNAAGTIGFKAVSRDANDNRSFLISCYHVLCASELNAGQQAVNNLTNTLDIISPEASEANNVTMGYVRKGALDGTIDAAYAELTRPDILNNIVYGTSFSPRTIVILGEYHVNLKYPLMLAGRTSTRQVGHVLSNYASVSVKYFDGNRLVATQQFDGVVKTCKISTFGDSGAPVIDTGGNAIGLLFASDDEFSYIIPLLKIFNSFNLTFPK